MWVSKLATHVGVGMNAPVVEADADVAVRGIEKPTRDDVDDTGDRLRPVMPWPPFSTSIRSIMRRQGIERRCVDPPVDSHRISLFRDPCSDACT
jgi:hypothetical protein